MFGWIFNGARVAAFARVIHEMSASAHHLRDITNAPLHRFFARHPLLKQQRVTEGIGEDAIHMFWLSDGKIEFAVMVSDGDRASKPWLSIAPSGAFQGAHIQSSSTHHYMVRVDKPLSRPEGKLARKLIDRFIIEYDAIDLSM